MGRLLRFIGICLVAQALLLGGFVFVSRLQAAPTTLAYTRTDSSREGRVMLLDIQTGVAFSVQDVSSYTPRWSPDGKQLSYLMIPQRTVVEVGEYSLQQSTVRNLTADLGYLTLPYYGADPTLRAFLYFAPTGDTHLHLLDLTTEADPLVLTEQLIGLPQWSPDGTYLAYMEADEPTPEEIDAGVQVSPETDIIAYDTTSGEKLNLTLDTTLHGNPMWSPDGTRIVFVAQRREGQSLFLLDVAERTVTPVPESSMLDNDVQWSPDGTALAFVSTRTGDNEIYVVELEAGTLTNLTQHDSYDISPRWSPDGTHIAFVSGRDGNDDLYSVSLATGAIRRLTHTETAETQPAWQP